MHPSEHLCSMQLYSRPSEAPREFLAVFPSCEAQAKSSYIKICTPASSLTVVTRYQVSILAGDKNGKLIAFCGLTGALRTPFHLGSM